MLRRLGCGRRFPGSMGYAVRADDAGIALQSPGSMAKMMEVVVKGVHGVRPDGVISQDGGKRDLHGNKDTPTVAFSAHAAGQVYKQTNKLAYVGGGGASPTHPTSAASVEPLP